MRKSQAVISDISTAVPEYCYTQDEILKLNLRLVGDTPKKRNFLEKIYNGSMITKRYSVIKDFRTPAEEHVFYPKSDDFLPEPSVEQRNELYNRESGPLAAKAVNRLLKKSGVKKESITHLITASCTGFRAPGIDYYLIKTLKLNTNISRFHVGFMGCFAGFPALNLAAQIARNDENASVLVVNVELCSLHFQQKFVLDNQVSNALFADGASAALIVSEAKAGNRPFLRLNNFFTELLPGSENEMSWDLGATAFDMKLSVRVPDFIGRNIDSLMSRFYRETGLSRRDIGYWAVHPGGKAILEAVAEKLDLTKTDLKESWSVLANYGNMSSATIMFIFEKILKAKKIGPVFAAGFGPGLTVEMAHLSREG